MEITSLILLIHSLPSGKVFGYQLLCSPSLSFWIVSRKHHQIFFFKLSKQVTILDLLKSEPVGNQPKLFDKGKYT